MPWTLWQQDLNDRTLAPVADSAGADPVKGLAVLWRRTLDEGVHSDGHATHLLFYLEDSESKVRVQLTTAHPGKPEQALAKLRRAWKHASEDEREALVRALGTFHQKRRGMATDYFFGELQAVVSKTQGIGAMVKALLAA